MPFITTAEIKLSTAGAGTGPFNLYANTDGFTVPFEVGISKAALLAGFITNNLPVLGGTPTIIRVKSTLYCTNYVDISVTPLPTTTTTTSTTTTTTPP